MRVVFLILGVFVSVVLSAKESDPVPRIDLYKKIKKETGISLKEAFLALEKSDGLSVIKIETFAKNYGLKPLIDALNTEITQLKAHCQKTNEMNCSESGTNLNEQLNYIENLNKNYASLSDKKKLYYNLMIYSFAVKNKVLKVDLEKWINECDQSENINTKECKKSLYQIHSFFDISQAIVQLAYLRSENQPNKRDKFLTIRKQIEQYEHF